MATQTAAPQTTPQPPPNSINVNTLGSYVDGWWDIVEGMGEKVTDVRQALLKHLTDRGMPDVAIKELTGYVSLLSNEKRPYAILKTQPGATTAIYVGQYGKDLYVAWRTFLNQVFNQKLLLWMGGIAAFMGLFIGGVRQTGGFFEQSRTVFSFGGWIGGTVGIFLVEALLVMAAGRFLKGGLFAYFFVDPNLFDTDDIIEMGLATHQSILRVLDDKGIDVTKLRLKTDFRSGRRSERT